MLMLIESKLLIATFRVEHEEKAYNVRYCEEITLKEKEIKIHHLDEDGYIHQEELPQTPGTIGYEISEAVNNKIALYRKDWL